jgi:hypothetical protein
MMWLWLYLAGVVVMLVCLGVYDAIILESRKKIALKLDDFFWMLIFGWPVALVVFAIWGLMQIIYIASALITCVIIGKIKHKRKEQNK